MSHPHSLRKTARSLRASGFSVKQIARRCGIAVSTASLWVRTVALEEAKRTLLLQGRVRGSQTGLARLALRSAYRTAKWVDEARIHWLAWNLEQLFLLGVMMYWCEGGKTDRRLVFTNSDPRMLLFWLSWCRRYLPLGLSLYCKILIHDVNRQEKVQGYWKRLLGLKSKIYVKKKKKPKRRSGLGGRLPYGVVQIIVGRGSAEWHTKMMEWIRLLGGNSSGVRWASSGF